MYVCNRRVESWEHIEKERRDVKPCPALHASCSILQQPLNTDSDPSIVLAHMA
jgi:hypothetical protein